jgi:NAD(P)H dehydrogenase (quinone)
LELKQFRSINRIGAFLGVMGQSQLDMSGKEAELDPGDWPCQAPKDRVTAHHFGQRIAEVTERYVANSLVAAD